MALNVVKGEKLKTIQQVCDEGGFSFNAIPLKSLVKKTITIYGFQELMSPKFKKPYLMVDAGSGGKRFKVACGAQVVMNKIKTLVDYFPFQAKVVKVKRYYDLV